MKHAAYLTEGTRTYISSFARRATLTCAISCFAALSPISERAAHAQDAPPSQSASTEPYAVQGQSAELKNNERTLQVYVVFKQGGIAPVIEAEGPVTLSLRFYPAVSKDWFSGKTTEYQRTIDYSVELPGAAPSAQTFSGMTSQSDYKSASIQDPLGIGTPIDFMVDFPTGKGRVTVKGPNGFLVILKADVPAPEPVKMVAIPKSPKASLAPVKEAPSETPAQKEEPKKHGRPIFALSGERSLIRGLGAQRNQGDINEFQGYGNLWLGERFALTLGASATSYGLSAESAGAETSLRSISGVLSPGLTFRSDDHYFRLQASAGLRRMQTSIHSGSRSLDKGQSEIEAGGSLAYEYGTTLALGVSGSNNPFLPFSARFYGAIPATWAKTSYPDLEVRLRLLHSLESAGNGNLGAFSLSENNVHLLGVARIPIYPVGPLSTYLMAAPEYAGKLSVYLGGSLGLELAPLRIEATGGVNPYGHPLLLFGASVSR
jgi:hypothetical protein